jgi:hypothetical protein
MYKQRADTGILCDRSHTSYCVLEQGGAKLDTLNASINREPCEHHYWHWIRHVATDGASGILVRDCPRCQSVIPNHALVGIDHDESATGPVQMVGQCTPPQPIVQ